MLHYRLVPFLPMHGSKPLNLFSLCIFCISDWKKLGIGLSHPRSETIASLVVVSFNYGASDLWLFCLAPFWDALLSEWETEKSSIGSRIRRFNLQRCLEWAVADAAQPRSSARAKQNFLRPGSFGRSWDGRLITISRSSTERKQGMQNNASKANNDQEA